MEKKGSSRTGIIVSMGLALFASLFGAGNLIFPPFLGMGSGKDWITGFLGFFIMDAGMAAFTVFAVVGNRKSTINGVMGKVGNIPGKIMMILVILCIGPGIGIPRTAVTSYELGISTLFPGLPQWAFGAIFFALTFFLVIRPNKVVDIVGNFLTPALLIVMALLIVTGITHPISDPVQIQQAATFKAGVQNGYQTMDGMAAVMLVLMLITAANAHGITSKKEIKWMVAGADVIACILLGIIYGGLTYLGAMVSGDSNFQKLEQAPLLISITNTLLGKYGVLALSIIVFLACLTTAIGLVTVAGTYFEDVSNGKLKYRYVVIAVILISYAMSNFGLSTIIGIAAPILSILYPPIIVLIICTVFENVIKNDRATAVTAYVSLAISLVETLKIPVLSDLVASLPLASYGLSWLLPAVVVLLASRLLLGRSDDYRLEVPEDDTLEAVQGN